MFARDFPVYMTATSNNRYYASAISAFVVWGFLPMVLRSLSGASSGAILYFRILFSTAILIAIMSLFRRSKLQRDRKQFLSANPTERRNVVLLWLAGGALLTINWLTFIYTVNHVNIRTASFSYFICPVLTAVLGYMVLKEKMTSIQWVAVGLCAVSCVMMGLSSVSELGYSFTTAFTYGLYLVLQRLYKEYDRMTVLSVQILFSFLLLNVAYPWLIDELPSDSKFYWVTAAVAAFFTVLPLFLNLFALIRINSATVGILMYINPIINFAIAFIVFHEQTTLLQVAAYVIIGIGLVLFNWRFLVGTRLSAAGS